jgi:glutathione S-transferase
MKNVSSPDEKPTIYSFEPKNKYISDWGHFTNKVLIFMLINKIDFNSKSAWIYLSPGGQLPYANIDGIQITDSQEIILSLCHKYVIDMEVNLNSEQRAMSKAIQALIDKDLFFTARSVIFYKHNKELQNGICLKHYSVFSRPLIKLLWNCMVRKRLRNQGSGHIGIDRNIKEMHSILEHLSIVLGDKKYLFSDYPSLGDISMAGFLLTGLYSSSISSFMKQYIIPYENLCSYGERIYKDFWSANAYHDKLVHY